QFNSGLCRPPFSGNLYASFLIHPVPIARGIVRRADVFIFLHGTTKRGFTTPSPHNFPLYPIPTHYLSTEFLKFFQIIIHKLFTMFRVCKNSLLFSPKMESFLLVPEKFEADQNSSPKYLGALVLIPL